MYLHLSVCVHACTYLEAGQCVCVCVGDVVVCRGEEGKDYQEQRKEKRVEERI